MRIKRANGTNTRAVELMRVIGFILLAYLMNRSIKNLIITMRRFYFSWSTSVLKHCQVLRQQTTGYSLMHLAEGLIQNDLRYIEKIF